jgi:hypothetical protein
LPASELTTRPIRLNPGKKPYEIIVSSALAENIDPTARNASSGRSQLRSFPLSSTPADFFSGKLLAYGIRNPAGFDFWPPSLVGVAARQLWVVENGASIDDIPGFTAAFANDNPADELELVDVSKPAGFYGFPDCTTLWNPNADPIGEPQYVNGTTGDQFSLHLLPERDDSWCQRAVNNVPPRLSFQVCLNLFDLSVHDTHRKPALTRPTPYLWT